MVVEEVIILTHPKIILIGIKKTINSKVKEIIFKVVIDLMSNVIIVVKLAIIRMNVGPIKSCMLKWLKIVVIERRPSCFLILQLKNL